MTAMPSPAPPLDRPPPATLAAGGILAVAVAAGLLAGGLEVAVALWRRFAGGRLWLFGPELAWMTPLAEGVIFAALGAAYAILSRVARPLRRTRAVVAGFSGLGLLVPLLGVDALHPAASAVLAAGLGVGLARALPAPVVVAQRVGTIGAGLLILTAIGTGVAGRWPGRPASPVTPASSDRPNVLLLVLDTVRAWNLGWYGYGRATTPLLDRRLAGGVIFDRALATAPWTLPSHASLFTGRLPLEVSASWDRPLDRTFPTVAERFAAAGYATGGFVGNYRYTGASTGLARGFATYVDYPIDVAEAIRMTGPARRILRVPAVQEWLGRRRILEARTAADVNGDLLGWIDRRGERPFFAFVNYVDAHSPYLSPAPYDSLWIRGEDRGAGARRYAADMAGIFGPGPIPGSLLAEYLDGYDGSLRYLDRQIDSLLGALDRRGLLRNTIVVITSDHGEHFGEHHLIQHGNSLYLPLLHVPLAFWGPGRIPAGVRVGAPTSLRHLAATLVDLAGIGGEPLPGRSLAAHWQADSLAAEADQITASVTWHPTVSRFPPSPLLGGSLGAILVDSLHYIRRSDGTEELFDLSRDFLETRNLAGIPTYRAALLDARRAWDAAAGGRSLGPGPAGAGR